MTTYRNQRQKRISTAYGVFFAAVTASALIRGGPLALLVVPVLLAPVYPLARLAHARVELEAAEVRIVNPFREEVVAWDEVDRFDLRYHFPMGWRGVLDTRDGRVVSLWGVYQFFAESFPWRRPRRLQAMVDELEEQRLAHR